MTSDSEGLEVSDHYVFLELLHDLLRPEVYLETGVESGRTLALAKKIAVGIDPEPRVTHDLGSDAQVFAMTSDDFFASYTLPSLTAARPIDLAFIDGLHLFENALRDFINIEKYAHPGTVVCIHDVLPQTVKMASREAQYDGWTGDVFGLILALREHRPDLVSMTVNVPATGMLIVTNLNPGNPTLPQRFDRIVLQHKALQYANIHEARDEIFDTVPYSRAILDYCVASMQASRAFARLRKSEAVLSADPRVRLPIRGYGPGKPLQGLA